MHSKCALAICVLMVSWTLACGSGENSSNMSASSTPTTAPRASSEAKYISDFLDILDELSKSEGIPLPPRYADPAWSSEVLAILATRTAQLQRYERLDPPPSLRRFHDKILEALDLTEQQMALASSGLNEAKFLAIVQLEQQAAKSLEDAVLLLPAP